MTLGVPSQAASRVTCANLTHEVQIRNRQYVARLSKGAIGLSVTRLKPDGSAGSVAFSGDRIGLGFDSPLPASVTDAQLTDVQVSVDKCYSFYARLSVTGKLDYSNLATFSIKRTYEFTRSRNIYAQLEIWLERAFGPVRVVA